MSDWTPDLYLTFSKERTQPAIDLAARIQTRQPRRIIDIGCGPGNSTKILKERWPFAEITGIDSSANMIDEASDKYPDIEWVCADASGDLSHMGLFDVIFSNAAIQWMPNHDKLLRNLFDMLNPSGVLAVQTPDASHMPVHVELAKLAFSDKWANKFTGFSGTHSTYHADFYYNIIAGLSNMIDLWETRYFHVMNSHAEIVDWYRSTGLKPYLDCLREESLRAEFLFDFKRAMTAVYHMQANGKVLFPFTRIFFIVKK